MWLINVKEFGTKPEVGILRHPASLQEGRSDRRRNLSRKKQGNKSETLHGPDTKTYRYGHATHPACTTIPVWLCYELCTTMPVTLCYTSCATIPVWLCYTPCSTTPVRLCYEICTTTPVTLCYTPCTTIPVSLCYTSCKTIPVSLCYTPCTTVYTASVPSQIITTEKLFQNVCFITAVCFFV